VHMLLVLLPSVLALSSSAAGGVKNGRAQQLTVLRDVAKVRETLEKVQGSWSPGAVTSPEALGTLYTSLQAETSDLLSNMHSFEPAVLNLLSAPPLPTTQWPLIPKWTSTLAPGQFESNSRYERELQALRARASGLHAQIDMQREQLALLEEAEMSAESRARQVFDALDANGDGSICLTEFTEAALFSIDAAALERRFEEADIDGDGTLGFEEFANFLNSLSEGIDPIRAARASGLEALLETTLEMTSLSLTRDLTAATSRSTRTAEQLSDCVDRWCELESRLAVEAAADREPSGGADAVACEARLDALLLDVGQLATDLALTNVTTSVEWSLKKSSRLLMAGARGCAAFCVRGLRITWGDISESAGLLVRAVSGCGLQQQEASLIKRTISDCFMLVPYGIIMIIPLSPPGHVFAFSLLNRVFPGAVPSGFTAQRQDIDELYARIAADAADKPSTLRRLSTLVPIHRAKRVWRRVWRSRARRAQPLA